MLATSAETATPEINAPGEKRVTVRSEIERGDSEIFNAAFNRPGGWWGKPFALTGPGLQDLSLRDLCRAMNDAIDRNKALQKDSDGFMLGARFQELEQLDAALRAHRVAQFNADIGHFFSLAKQYANEVRALQKKLGIDDSALAEAQVMHKSVALSEIRRLLSSY